MSMLIFLAILAVYLGIPILLFRAAIKTDELGIKVVASVVALVILLGPIWDMPIVAYRFNKLCEEEGGIFVYERVGLGDEFFLQQGEMTEKLVERPGEGRNLRSVKATGNELIIDQIEKHFDISTETDNDATDWPGTVKNTTSVRSDGAILGRAISFNGGAGWLLRKFNYGSGPPGVRCPVYEWESDKPSIRERLLYEIFYKR